MKTLSQNSRPPSPDFNLRPTKYEAGVLANLSTTKLKNIFENLNILKKGQMMRNLI
jgi:hypothetical protein